MFSQPPATAESHTFSIETERESDDRWIAEIPALPGVIVYGTTREEALRSVRSLAMRVLADRIEHGETVPAFVEALFTIQ